LAWWLKDAGEFATAALRNFLKLTRELAWRRGSLDGACRAQRSETGTETLKLQRKKNVIKLQEFEAQKF
jgi:hypothetical protein